MNSAMKTASRSLLVSKPFVHLFSTLRSEYLYDVGTNRVFPLTNDQHKYISSILGNICEVSNVFPETIRWFESMQSRDFFLAKHPQKVLHPASEYIPDLLEGSLSSLTLQVTQECNMRCSYCAYSGNYENRKHSPKKMSIATMEKAIDFFLEHSYESPNIHLGFYGGEPLLNFNLIMRAVDHTLLRTSGRKILFGMTTNGTLLTEKSIRFLVKNDFNLAISIDGPREVHDQNRVLCSGAGSFNLVIEGIKKIFRIYPEYARRNLLANVIIDAGNCFSDVLSFFDSSDEISNELSLNVSSLNPKSLKKDQKVFNETKRYNFWRNYEQYLFYYLLALTGRIKMDKIPKIILKAEQSALMNVRERLANHLYSIPDFVHHAGPCIPGIRKLFVDVDGNFYPCERVDENADDAIMGNIYEGFDTKKVNNILNVGSLTESECLDCWALWLCNNCISCSLKHGKVDRDTKLKWCDIIRQKAHHDLKKMSVLNELNIM